MSQALSAGRVDRISFLQVNAILAALLGAGALASAIRAGLSNPYESGWVVILIAVPSAVALLTVLLLANERLLGLVVTWAVTFAVFLQSYALSSFRYCDQLDDKEACRPEELERLATRSGFYTVMATLVVLGVLILAALLIKARRGHLSSSMNAFMVGMVNKPLPTICFFLTAFTFIASFLSFALAFHDQALRGRGERALYALQVPPEAPLSNEAPQQGAAVAEATIPEERSQETKCWELAQQPPWKIRFDSGSVIVAEDIMVSSYHERKIEELWCDFPHVSLGTQNSLVLAHLWKQIEEQASSERVQVVLVGHTNKEVLDEKASAYSSNFELSEARVHHVVIELIKRLEASKKTGWRRNVEWVRMPVADGASFLSDVPLSDNFSEDFRSDPRYLSVEIALLPSAPRNGEERRLTMLDYFYFMTYTITTTGYGDIIPVSDFSKFLTSVANLFEMVLVVIFFNVLMSFFWDAKVGCSNRIPVKPETTPATSP